MYCICQYFIVTDQLDIKSLTTKKKDEIHNDVICVVGMAVVRYNRSSKMN